MKVSCPDTTSHACRSRRISQAGATQQRDEFLSRPRFLAITEFGPRAVVYHEGSRYLINKAILPLGQDGPVFGQLKRCTACGYLHPITSPPGPDLCENCQTSLDTLLTPMMRLQNVSTRRKDKINSDEEERLRLGYETQSGFRYAVYRGVKSHQTALVRSRIHDFWPVELRTRGDTLAHQPGMDAARGQKPVRLRSRHRTRLLATQRPDAGRRRRWTNSPAVSSE